MESETLEKFGQATASDVTDPIERIILRSMNEGVITLECNGRIRTMNPAALRILAFGKEELRGKQFEEIFSDSDNAEFNDIFTNIIHHGIHTTQKEVQFKRRDGQIIDLAVATSYLDTPECLPSLQTVVTVFRDITAFKVLERMRRRAVDHLSHELKTPLAVIEATVEILREKEPLEPSILKDLERIKRNLNRLMNIQEIVQEILSPKTFRARPFDLVPTVEEILADIRSVAAHRSVRLTAHLEPVRTDILDPDLLSLVLHTLVKNAIENTPDGADVTVSIEPNRSGLLLKVEDRGIGIPVADQPFIFEGFHHTQDTEEYSTKKPYDFNAGGKGLELLRLKMLSEAGYFDISFQSTRCRYIPSGGDECPGNTSECPHRERDQTAQEPCGTTFSVLFPDRRQR